MNKLSKKELYFYNREKEKIADELNLTNTELILKSKENKNLAAELARAKKVLFLQI